jgi:cytidylate kinase
VAGAGVGEPRVPDVASLTKVVALDGPAGSGKTTVARRTAQALGWRFVDTGATYRAVTLHVLRAGVPLEDVAGVARAAQEADLELDVDPESSGVRLAGVDVSAEIRSPEVTSAVSAVSAVPAVRARLVLLQRQLMGTDGAVVEGRDIATVVAPRAAVKVYLDAREEVRARRRAGEQPRVDPSLSGAARSAGGVLAVHDDGFGDVQEAIRRRDALDNQTNKLEVSEGAIHLDTSDLTLDEVVDAVVALVRAAGFEPSSGRLHP